MSNLKCGIAYLLAVLFRIIKNIMPTTALKHKCHLLKRNYSHVSQNYTFFTIPEYSKLKNISFNIYEIDSSKIYVIKNFYINYFNDCAYVHDGQKHILNESFPYNNQNKDLFKLEIIKNNKIKIKCIDKAINCAMNSGKNYWHFTYTMLPLIYAMEKSGYNGKYLLWDISFIKQLVELLGINSERLEFVKEGDAYQIKELHVIDDYCWASSKKPELLVEMKDKILSNIDLSDINKYPNRLYVRRLKPYTRVVKNETAVLGELEKYGFKAISPDDYSVIEQIKYFRSADIIICPHGACSTNALFMKPNAHFIECFGFNYVNPCMLQIIKPNNISYNMLVETGESINVAEQISDYNINMCLLDDTLYRYI